MERISCEMGPHCVWIGSRQVKSSGFRRGLNAASVPLFALLKPSLFRMPFVYVGSVCVYLCLCRCMPLCG